MYAARSESVEDIYVGLFRERIDLLTLPHVIIWCLSCIKCVS